MRTITAKDVLTAPAFSDEELIAAGPIWCIVCEKFIPLANHSFIGSLDAGGTYCSWHTQEQIKAATKRIRGAE